MLDLSSLLCRHAGFQGDIDDYIELLYNHFCNDFITNQPYLGSKPVDFTNKKKAYKDKEETFWKLVSADQKVVYHRPQNNDRLLFYPRAERIRWVKEIIDNFPDDTIRFWDVNMDQEIRHHLWYKDEYIVVVGEKRGYFYLVTGFYVVPEKKEYYESQYSRYK